MTVAEIRILLKSAKPADRAELVLRCDREFETLRPDDHEGVSFSCGRFASIETFLLPSAVQIYMRDTYLVKAKREDVKMLLRYVAEQLEEAEAS